MTAAAWTNIFREVKQGPLLPSCSQGRPALGINIRFGKEPDSRGGYLALWASLVKFKFESTPTRSQQFRAVTVPARLSLQAPGRRPGPPVTVGKLPCT